MLARVIGCCPCGPLGSRPPGPGTTCILGSCCVAQSLGHWASPWLCPPWVSAPLGSVWHSAECPTSPRPSLCLIQRFLRTCSVSGTGVAQTVHQNTDEDDVGSCLVCSSAEMSYRTVRRHHLSRFSSNWLPSHPILCSHHLS